MAQQIWRSTSESKNVVGIISANSVTYAIADLVNVSDAGFLQLVPTASTRILGASVDVKVADADNQTVAAYKPKYLSWRGLVLLLGTNVDLAQTNVGEFMDLDTFTTGAFRVTTSASTNESSTTTGTGNQLKCLDFDPNKDGTNNLGLFEVAYPSSLSIAA